LSEAIVPAVAGERDEGDSAASSRAEITVVAPNRLDASRDLLRATAWALIDQPAMVRSAMSPHAEGRWVRKDAGIHILAAAWAAEQALTLSLSKPVLLSLAGSRAIVPVIHIGITSPRMGVAPIVISLDAAAARLLANAVSRRFVHAQPLGALCAAEFALIDYLTLEVLDRLGVPGLSHVSTEPGARSAAARGRISVTFEITCGGGAGLVSVQLDGAWEVSPTPLTWAAVRGSAPKPSGRTVLSIALPAVQIDDEELRSLAVGDCVLCGLAGLTGALGCDIINEHGWALGAAHTICDSATGVTCKVRWGDQPEPACLLAFLPGSEATSPPTPPVGDGATDELAGGPEISDPAGSPTIASAASGHALIAPAAKEPTIAAPEPVVGYTPCRVAIGSLAVATADIAQMQTAPEVTRTGDLRNSPLSVSFPLGPASAWLLAGGARVARGELCLVEGEVALRVIETDRLS